MKLLLIVFILITSVQAKTFSRYMKFDKFDVVDVRLSDGNFKDLSQLTSFNGVITKKNFIYIDLLKNNIENIQFKNGQILDLPKSDVQSHKLEQIMPLKRFSGSGGGGPG